MSDWMPRRISRKSDSRKLRVTKKNPATTPWPASPTDGKITRERDHLTHLHQTLNASSLLVAFGAPALDFVSRNREKLFPDVPVVSTGAEKRHVESRLGMGLAICHYIIDAHHGKISAISPPAGGATVRFTLPTSLPTSGGGRDARATWQGLRLLFSQLMKKPQSAPSSSAQACDPRAGIERLAIKRAFFSWKCHEGFEPAVPVSILVQPAIPRGVEPDDEIPPIHPGRTGRDTKPHDMDR